MPTDQPQQPDREGGIPRDEAADAWSEGHVRRVDPSEHSARDDADDVPEDREAIVEELTALRREADLLRHRLSESPGRIRMLEERLLETKGRLQSALAQNTRLTETLEAARQQLAALRDEVERLSTPPQNYASFVSHDLEDDTLVVVAQGRKMKVQAADEVEVDDLRPGQEVLLNEASNVVGIGAYDDRGEILSVSELLEDGRALVVGHADEERIVQLADALREGPLKAGDSVLVDLRANVALERIPKAEVEQLVLEQVPDVTYDQIGGLKDQVEAIRDAIELPYLHGDLFVEHELRPPKGILLYGPPGCGKTMIAKAVANSLAQRVAEKTGRDDVRSYFLNVKGPELLNKYVGETERQIRLIFQRAREKASEGFPVIVFFDEMESLFRTRGSGVSSDVETTVVPQLLAEIDGVESLKDVVVIGASNREDMIDPAILRPGRLDVKIKVERPDAAAAREVFSIYLHPGLPLHDDEVKAAGGDPEKAVHTMLDAVVAKMYAEDDDTKFLEVTYANSEKQILYFKDFNSGAMIENVVARSKKYAIKRFLLAEERGISTEDLLRAIKDEFRENEDLPNTTNPDDWARISALKGERIVYIRTLTQDGDDPGRAIENLNPGQYL